MTWAPLMTSRDAVLKDVILSTALLSPIKVNSIEDIVKNLKTLTAASKFAGKCKKKKEKRKQSLGHEPRTLEPCKTVDRDLCRISHLLDSFHISHLVDTFKY